MVLNMYCVHGALIAQWIGKNNVRRQLICPLEAWSLVVGKEYIFLMKQEKAYKGLSRQEQKPPAHVWTSLVVSRVKWEWEENLNSCCEHVSALPQFFILLLIILLSEVVLAILLFVYEQKLDNYVAEGLRHSIEHYNDTIAAWDSIQSFLQCCGIHNKSDWKDITPKSCPEGEVEGCYKKAQEWFHTNFLYIGIITICVCVIQVLGMSFALTLNCQIDKSSRVLGL
ncbi:leukocyte surface antigen CD53 isoform 1-T1 [Trichechus inunguis]